VAEGLKEAVVQVEVIDLSGRAVHQWSATATNGRLRKDLALDLAPGTYLLRLRSGDGLSVTRLVVR